MQEEKKQSDKTVGDNPAEAMQSPPSTSHRKHKRGYKPPRDDSHRKKRKKSSRGVGSSSSSSSVSTETDKNSTTAASGTSSAVTASNSGSKSGTGSGSGSGTGTGSLVSEKSQITASSATSVSTLETPPTPDIGNRIGQGLGVSPSPMNLLSPMQSPVNNNNAAPRWPTSAATHIFLRKSQQQQQLAPVAPAPNEIGCEVLKETPESTNPDKQQQLQTVSYQSSIPQAQGTPQQQQLSQNRSPTVEGASMSYAANPSRDARTSYSNVNGGLLGTQVQPPIDDSDIRSEPGYLDYLADEFMKTLQESSSQGSTASPSQTSSQDLSESMRPLSHVPKDPSLLTKPQLKSSEYSSSSGSSTGSSSGSYSGSSGSSFSSSTFGSSISDSTASTPTSPVPPTEAELRAQQQQYGVPPVSSSPNFANPGSFVQSYQMNSTNVFSYSASSLPPMYSPTLSSSESYENLATPAGRNTQTVQLNGIPYPPNGTYGVPPVTAQQHYNGRQQMNLQQQQQQQDFFKQNAVRDSSPSLPMDDTADSVSRVSLSEPDPDLRELDEDGNIKIQWKKANSLGLGQFGRVFMGIDSERGEFIAVREMKVKSKEKKESALFKEMQRGIQLLRYIRHPNLIRYLGIVVNGLDLMVFMEYIPSGSIASLVSTLGPMKENIVQLYVRQLLEALQFLHSHAIFHQRLRGSNILLSSGDNGSVVKLADYGYYPKYADLIRSNREPALNWTAPEAVIDGLITGKMDSWSLGCVIIEMSTAKPPWSDLEASAVTAELKKRSVPPYSKSMLSNFGTDFLTKCLTLDHNARPSVKELLSHPWIQSESYSASDGSAGTRPLSHQGQVRLAQQQRAFYPRHGSTPDVRDPEGRYLAFGEDFNRSHSSFLVQGRVNCSLPSTPSYSSQPAPLPAAVVPSVGPQRLKFMNSPQERVYASEYFAASNQQLMQPVSISPEARNYFQQMHLQQLEKSYMQAPMGQGDISVSPIHRSCSDTFATGPEMSSRKHHSSSVQDDHAKQSSHSGERRGSDTVSSGGRPSKQPPRFTSVADAVRYDEQMRDHLRSRSSGPGFRTSVADVVRREEVIRRNARAPSLDVNDHVTNPYSFEDGIDITVASAAVQQVMEERARKQAAARWPGYAFHGRKYHTHT